MIEITDGVRTICINKNSLDFDKENNELILKAKMNYWCTVLGFDLDKNKNISRIVKRFYDGDIHAIFYNLGKNKDNVLLSKKEFDKFELIYSNMKSEVDYKKNAMINAGVELFSFLCYQYYVLEDLNPTDIDIIFEEISNDVFNYKKYKKEIYLKSKDLLNEKYKVNYLDNILIEKSKD